ncbi:protein kinase, partial [Desulfococcaceae bacterium HSG7]|nr:protein kinase [Desulfococcaceae bacterium HSG7]
MFKINLFKSIVSFIVWICFAAALFFYYYHTITKQVTSDLSSAYIQSGMRVIKDLLDPGNPELIGAYQKKDKAFLNKRINAVYKLIDRVEFTAILDQEGNVIIHRDFALPIIRKKLHVTKEKPRIIIEMAWSRRYDRIVVIFSSDDSWYKRAKIYLAIPSDIPNPLNDYLFLTAAFGLLLILIPLRKPNQKPAVIKTPLPSEDQISPESVNADKMLRSFGSYKLIEKIDAGGMATVYKAYKNNRKSKSYAVKIPDYDKLTTDDFHLLFEREVKISKELSNDNIILVYEHVIKGSEQALVMEYINGKNLDQIVSRLKSINEALPLNLLVYIAAKICAGLEYCHSKDIVHR